MSSSIDSNLTAPVLTEAEVQKCLDHVDAIAAILASHVSTLSPEDRRRRQKARKGTEVVVPILAGLATRFGLTGPSIDVPSMVREAELGTLLVPLLGRVRTLNEMLADTVLVSRGNAWHTAGTLHSVLVRLSKKNPAILGEIAGIAPFFANKRRKTAATPAQPAPTPPPVETKVG